MKYGHFDYQKKEYIIETYRTPLPWINYLTNGKMFSLISHLGGGYSYYKDAKLRRMTRFFYNSPSRDNGGRFYYIDDGEFIFSPSFYPAKTELDQYECHVGLNYSRFASQKNELNMDLLCFIPLDDNVEINYLKLKNTSKAPKKLLLYGGVEFCLWNAEDDMNNFQRNFSTGEVEVHPSLIVHKTEYRERRNHFSFFSVNKPTSSFETSRDNFLGQFGEYSSPKEIKEKKLSNTVTHGWSPVAFHQLEITLQPNEEKEFIFLLGYVENKEEEKFDQNGQVNLSKAFELKQKYQSPVDVRIAFDKLKAHWNEILSHYQISSRDDKLNTMVNIWHQYQCMMTYYASRSASYYESGIGRGMGFRDSCQDLLGFVHISKEMSRERILDLASIMKEDGSTYHQYQPLDKKGNSQIGDGFNDDPLWLVAATYAYLSEWGDYSILDEKIPYNSDPNTNGTLLEHLKNAVYYTINHRGPHHLPLIGHADWNDCLNLNCFSSEPGQSFQCYQGQDTGVAESIFIGAMFVKYAKQYLEIISKKQRRDLKVERVLEEMKEKLEEYGFEEDHYLRAYDAYGNKVGSNHNEEGQIYIEPQGMCVMAGLGLDNGHAKLALDSVNQRLNTKYGICLLSPCYSKYHLELGEISSYPQGYKENGGIFCHNNPWIMIAECIVNRGYQAFEYYKEITPAYIEGISDIHKTEPYVYSQMIAGKEAPTHGEAKNSWLTGTAAWTFVAVSQYMIGVRPNLDGLIIDPKLNMEMNVTRKYRGKTIHIHINKYANKSYFLPNEKIDSLRGDIYVEL